MFLSINKKNNVYLCKPQFYCIKVGFKRSKLYRHVFVMGRAGVTLYTLSTILRSAEAYKNSISGFIMSVHNAVQVMIRLEMCPKDTDGPA